MNRREYLTLKAREYREKQRGKPARPYKKTENYQIGFMSIEVIMKQAGHCGYCGILLSHPWHDAHPLVGCEKYIKEYHSTRKQES